MPHCHPKQSLPCLHYQAGQQSTLTAFPLENGGKEPRFDSGGSATILTNIRGEERYIFLKVGSWLRCLAKGQFMAHSETHFSENFTLV